MSDNMVAMSQQKIVKDGGRKDGVQREDGEGGKRKYTKEEVNNESGNMLVYAKLRQ